MPIRPPKSTALHHPQSAGSLAWRGEEWRPSSSFSSRLAWRRASRASRLCARAVRRHLPWPSQVAMPPMISPMANAPSRNRNRGASRERRGSLPPKGSSTRIAGVRLTTASATSRTPSGTTTSARTSLRHTAVPQRTNSAEKPLALAVAFRVKPLAQLLAGLEEGHVFVLHKDRISGARIASLPRRSVLHGESPEATQLDPVPARESARDLIEHDVDDPFNVAMEMMRIGGRHPLNQLRLDHDTPHPARAPQRLKPLAPH